MNIPLIWSDSFFLIVFAARPQMSGNSTDKVWQTFTGILPGPLLLSTQGIYDGLAGAVLYRRYRSPGGLVCPLWVLARHTYCLCRIPHCWYEIVKEQWGL